MANLSQPSQRPGNAEMSEAEKALSDLLQERESCDIEITTDFASQHADKLKAYLEVQGYESETIQFIEQNDLVEPFLSQALQNVCANRPWNRGETMNLLRENREKIQEEYGAIIDAIPPNASAFWKKFDQSFNSFVGFLNLVQQKASSNQDINVIVKGIVQKVEGDFYQTASTETLQRESLSIFDEYQDCPVEAEGARQFLLGQWQLAKGEILDAQEQARREKKKPKGNWLDQMNGWLDSHEAQGAVKTNKTAVEKLSSALGISLEGQNLRQIENQVIEQIDRLTPQISNNPNYQKEVKLRREGLGSLDINEQGFRKYELLSSVPKAYLESEYYGQYKTLVENGEIQKSFSEFLSEDTNISSWERMSYQLTGIFAKLVKFLDKVPGNLFADFVAKHKAEQQKNVDRDRYLEPYKNHLNKLAIQELQNKAQANPGSPEAKRLTQLESWQNLLTPGTDDLRLDTMDAWEQATLGPESEAQNINVLKQFASQQSGPINQTTMQKIIDNSEKVRVNDTTGRFEINQAGFEEEGKWEIVNWADQDIMTALEGQEFTDHQQKILQHLDPTVKSTAYPELWKNDDPSRGKLKDGIYSLFRDAMENYWGDYEVQDGDLKLLAENLGGYTGRGFNNEKNVFSPRGGEGFEVHGSELFGKDEVFTDVEHFFQWLREDIDFGEEKNTSPNA